MSNKEQKAFNARKNQAQTRSEDTLGRKIVGTVQSPGQDTRESRRHPYSFRCTLHTKAWTKARVQHYAKVFGDAVRMKAKTKKFTEKKSFVRGLVNLFA